MECQLRSVMQLLLQQGKNTRTRWSINVSQAIQLVATALLTVKALGIGPTHRFAIVGGNYPLKSSQRPISHTCFEHAVGV